ncbi:MAG: hypothetical protein N2Z81_00400 [Hydrogenothermaceae bacterium]|nr:hypothetical protein [Hydrogenothermaceae bacterium]
MKKLVLGVSAAVLSASLLFSCQKKEEQPAEQPAPAEQQAAPAPAEQAAPAAPAGEQQAAPAAPAGEQKK